MKNIHAIYFSPTNTTKKVVIAVADEFKQPMTIHNLTKYPDEQKQICFQQNDFVILGIPVYSGRVPETARERILKITAKGTKIALILTYGNRNYDDAMVELSDLVTESGFTVVSVAAFSVQHSIVPQIAAGRPDDQDQVQIEEYGQQLCQKHETITGPVKVPGNRPYREYKKVGRVPKGKKGCDSCGLCARECPVHAIDPGNIKTADQEQCITCLRCVKVCPHQARDLSLIEKFAAKRMLKGICKERREPEIFW